MSLRPPAPARNDGLPKRLWLFKSDPESFSISDLVKAPKKTTPWDGVRNYQARNFLRDEVQVGDEVLFYHSSADEETGVVGTAVVTRAAYPDFTAVDPAHDHYDPDSDPSDPTWYLVDVRHQSTFRRCVTREMLAAHPLLRNMSVLRRGNRLSIMPVSKAEWDAVVKLGKAG
jgi:predicted RNA-binding protein with PUA-like domain